MGLHTNCLAGVGRGRQSIATVLSVALALTVGVLWQLAGPPVVSALGSFTVTTTIDASDANLADGLCDDGTGQCTLRAAIEQANFDGGATTITVPAGTFVLSVQIDSGLGYTTSTLDVEGDITVVGSGMNTTIIEYDKSDVNQRNLGLFQIMSGASLDLSAVTLTALHQPGRSGTSGIVLPYDGGSVLVSDVLFEGLGGVAVAAWDVSPNPDPSGLDIRVHDSRFEGANDFFNYSVLVSNVTDTYVEVTNTTVNDMGYALFVDGKDAPGNLLRVADSTFTSSDADPPGAFEIYDGFNAEITNTTMSGNSWGIYQGGGGLLTLSDSTISGNSQYGMSVGGGGTLIENTTFDDNGDFAIDVYGPLQIVGSTITGQSGAAITADFGNTTPDSITNTTISGNGYGVELSPGSVLRNVTITGNGDRGLDTSSGLTLYNTVVAGNEVDCVGGPIGGDHNADGDGTCGLTGTGDLSSIDPMLGPLADNGGPTFTQAPLTGSPLIDAGSDAECPVADQRGGARPFDGDGDGPATCDIGAVEAGAEIGSAPTLAWSGDSARRGMLAPDGNVDIVVLAGGGGIASAQVEASSWYPNGDTGEVLADSLADVLIDVALTESSPGTYTGSLPLAGIASISRITAHLEVGGDAADLQTTQGLPVPVAGGLTVESSIGLPGWMLPTPRMKVNSAAKFDGDAVVVPLVGSTPTRWLEPGDDYVAQLLDAQRRVIADPVTDIEVKGGLVVAVAVPGEPTPYVPFTAVIRDSNSAAIPGVKVSVLDPATGDEVAQAVTGADGTIAAVVSGDIAHVTVDPLDEPYLALEQDIVLTELGQVVDVGLGAGLPTSVVSGVVSHPLRPTVPGIRVSFTSHIGDRFFTTSAMTDADGVYSAEVFHGPVTISVENQRVGRASTSLVLVSDTVVDLTLEGPLMIDLDIEILTRFAGDAFPTPIDIDRPASAHYHIYATNGRSYVPVNANQIEFALYPGQDIKVCADGWEAGLPVGCAVADVDTTALTGTVSLSLEQNAAVIGTVEWTSRAYDSSGGSYRPELTGALSRVEADGTLTLVETVRLRVLDESVPQGGQMHAGFAVPIAEPGEYQLLFVVEHYVFVPCFYFKSEPTGSGPPATWEAPPCGEVWSGSNTSARIGVNVALDTVVDVGVVPITGGLANRFSGSRQSGTSVSPAVSLPGDVAQVRVAAQNSSTIVIDDAVVRFQLPAGTTLVDGSVTLDGVPVIPTITQGLVEVPAGTVARDRVVSLRAWLQLDADIAVDALVVEGSVEHTGVIESLGVGASTVRRLSLNSVDTTSDLVVPVWGRALPGATVEVTLDDAVAATAIATPGGVWNATVVLPETRLRRHFELQARSTGPAGALETEPRDILYDKTLPTLQRAVFSQSGGRVVDIDPSLGVAEFPYVWVPNQDIIVDLYFDNPFRVESPVVWVGSARSEAQFDDETGVWRARMQAGAGQLGEVRLDWNPIPPTYHFAPTFPQEYMTAEELRALLPAELATFTSIDLVEDTADTAAIQAEFPDVDAILDASISISSGTYEPTLDDLELEALSRVPIWDFDIESVEESDGSETLTARFLIPESATIPDASAERVTLTEGLAAVKGIEISLKTVELLRQRGFLAALFNAGMLKDLSGALVVDAFQDDLFNTQNWIERECGADPSLVSYLTGQLQALNGAFIDSLLVAAVLAVLGVAVSPATLGTSLLLTAAVEAVNQWIGVWLGWEFSKLKDEARTLCSITADPVDPDDLFDNPEPCSPLWSIVPTSLREPRCDPIANPTYIYDPSGFVFSVVEEDRLEGVTATLQSAADPGGPWSVWDAEWFGQSNPLVTDPQGDYGWDVPPGWWQVKYELDGYETAYSEILEVLPPHFDVNVGLRNLAVPAVESVAAVPGTTFIDVTFDRWMDVASMASERIELHDGPGPPVAVAISHPDERISAAGDPVAHVLRLDIGRPLVADESFNLELDRMIESAGEIPLGAELSLDVAAAKVPQSIDLGAIVDRTYGAAPFVVSATATSGLLVSIAASGPCTSAGQSVTVTGSGSCKVIASQAGNQQWLAAADVSTTFQIVRAPLTVTAANKSGTVGSPPPALTASATGLVNGDTLASLGGATCTSNAPIVGGLLATPGMYLISCTGPTTTKYDVTHVGAALTVADREVSAAVPLSPARLLETRAGEKTIDGQFEAIGVRAARSVTKVRIAGRGGVPADATAAMLNLTIVTPDGPGFATIYPCTASPPKASNINYTPGVVVANGVVAALDTNGDVCIYTLAASHILIDVNGFVPAGSAIGTLVPARLLETRAGEKTIDGQFEAIGVRAARSVTKVRIAGRGGVPADATAAMLNLTIVTPDGPGFATIYPCTASPPKASNINYAPGVVVANGVVAALDANGDICIYTLAASHILIDVGGYTVAGSGVGTLVPARLLETRAGEKTIDGQFEAIGVRAARSVTKVRIAGRGGVPADATAAMLNLTIVNPDGAGFATIYPCTASPPKASNINYTPVAVVANGVFAKLDANGDVCVFTLAASHVLIDVNAFLGD